jgi:hypothetical protein
MGSKFGYTSKLKTTSKRAFESKGISVEVAASASAFGATVSTSVKTSHQTDTASTFNNEKLSTSTFSVGSKPPTDSRAETWASNSIEEPMPIIYTLDTMDRAIAKALKSKKDKRVTMMKDALKGYCEYLHGAGKVKNCGPDESPLLASASNG